MWVLRSLTIRTLEKYQGEERRARERGSGKVVGYRLSYIVAQINAAIFLAGYLNAGSVSSRRRNMSGLFRKVNGQVGTGKFRGGIACGMAFELFSQLETHVVELRNQSLVME